MTTGHEQGNGQRFVQNLLPWILAAGALAVYLLTLNPWVNLLNLQPVARASGWVWQPEWSSPVTYLVLLPFHWLPPKWVPLALNLFAALCAALTLWQLARSVVLLPHDRTLAQRERETGAFGFLTGTLAWLPPTFAVLVCGLQLTFWENGTNGTMRMLDVLMFAYIIRCLLEYRIDERESRLVRAAFVVGLGMTNNFGMIAYLPLFLVALIWIRGFSFFQISFLTRMTVAGLAGLSLYLLLPAIVATSGTVEAGFWDALSFYLADQKRSLFGLPFNKAMLFFPERPLWILTLPSLLPLLLISVRWPTYFGDPSRLGVAISNWLFHLVHAAVLLACLWVALDPPFSPRNFGLPVLSFGYLGAMSVGYFSGYFLLVFRPIQARLRRYSAWPQFLHQSATALVLALLLVVTTMLVLRNLQPIRATNGSAMEDFARDLTVSLPSAGGVLLGDDPTHLMIAQSWLAKSGKEKDFLLLHTVTLTLPPYRLYLQKKYGQKWLEKDVQKDVQLSHTDLVNLMLKLAGQSEIHYLHPSFGYYFEAFSPQPHGLTQKLVKFGTGYLVPPPPTRELIDSNEAFWTKVADHNLKSITRNIAKKSYDKDSGLVSWIFVALRLKPETSIQDHVLGSFYSRALDYWGVELQKAGEFDKAAARFELAEQLNPNNVVARVNLEHNKRYRAGVTSAVQLSQSIEDFFGPYRSWDQLLGENGPYDEPSLSFAQGEVFLNGRNFRQAAQYFDRVRVLSPKNLESRLRLAQLHLVTGMPDRAAAFLDEIRAKPDVFPITGINATMMLTYEAALHLARNEPEKATRLIDTELARQPANALLIVSTVQLYADYGRNSNALAILDRQLLNASEDSTLLTDEFLLATATKFYTDNGRYSNALVILNRQLQRTPEVPPQSIKRLPLLINQGVVWMGLTNFHEAVRSLNQALAITNEPTALWYRAIAYLQSDRLDESKKDYEALMRQFPKSYVTYFGLHEIAYRRKETNAAIRFAEIFLTNAVPNAGEIQLVRTRLQELKGEKTAVVKPKDDQPKTPKP